MSKEFWKAALIRAVRTVCQTAIATIGTTAVLQDVNWILVLSSSALAGLLSDEAFLLQYVHGLLDGGSGLDPKRRSYVPYSGRISVLSYLFGYEVQYLLFSVFQFAHGTLLIDFLFLQRYSNTRTKVCKRMFLLFPKLFRDRRSAAPVPLKFHIVCR